MAMVKPAVLVRLVCLLLGAAISVCSARAGDANGDFVQEFSATAVKQILEGDAGAAATLRTLLAMPDPWRDRAIQAVEEELGPGDLPRSLAAGITGRMLGTAQGMEERSKAGTLELGVELVEVPLPASGTHWLRVKLDQIRKGELIIESRNCSPVVDSFARRASLPAPPVARAVRYSAELQSIPVDELTDLRIRFPVRERCKARDTVLKVRVTLPRTQIAAERGTVSTLEQDHVAVFDLGDRWAIPFAVRGEAGVAYRVLAAPVGREVDPALTRFDPSDTAAPVDENDDGDAGLSSALDVFYGTGRPAGLAVRRINRQGGKVAVLVQTQSIVEWRPEAQDRIQLSESRPEARRVELAAGTWVIRTRNPSVGADPAIIVRDELTGRVLGHNDDRADGDLSAEVALVLQKSQVIILELMSADGPGGTVELEIMASKAMTGEGARKLQRELAI